MEAASAAIQYVCNSKLNSTPEFPDPHFHSFKALKLVGWWLYVV